MNKVGKDFDVRKGTLKKILVIIFFLICTYLLFAVMNKNFTKKLQLGSWFEYYVIDLYSEDTLNQEFTINGNILSSLDLCIVDPVHDEEDYIELEICDRENNSIYYDKIYIRDTPNGSFFTQDINRYIKRNQTYSLDVTYHSNHDKYIQIMFLNKNDNLTNTGILSKNNLIQSRNLAIQYKYHDIKFLNIYQIIMLVLVYIGIYYCLFHTNMAETILNFIQKINKIKLFFYGMMSLSILICFIWGFITEGVSIQKMLHPNTKDTFMDYFNSIQYGRYPYENKVIYPPLINVIYAIIGHFSLIDNVDSFNLRTEQRGLFIFGIYIMITTLLFSYVIMKVKKGKEVEKIYFLLIILFSLPFMFMMERANSIIICVVAMMIFIFLYDSPETYLKHLAFISLGIAAAIKIYPLFLGLLLVGEKRYKDVIICVIYGFLIFLLPFGFTDGNVLSLLNNIINTNNEFQNVGHGVYVNLASTINYLSKLFEIPLYKFTDIFQFIIIIIGVILILFNKRMIKWKKVAILCTSIVLCAGFSAIYTLIYLIIPLILFLDQKPKFNVLNSFYIILFVLIFMPVINFDIGFLEKFKHDYYPLTISTIIESISLFLFIILLFIDGFLIWCKNSDAA